MSHELQVGQVLDERFEITGIIGRGGMSSVLQATDLMTGRTVAVKIPFLELESDPGFFSRFQREAEIGKRLDHPGILKILPVENASRPYLVMEYLEGQTLWDLLQAVHPLPVKDALHVARLTCDAMEYMHRNDVVHRDLKPNNIMLCHDGSLRIMDFGIAKAGAMRRLTFSGFSPRLGTPHYMAPEQVKGQRGDARTDIYGLAAILYEMVTGHPPFEADDAHAVMNARLSGDPVAPRTHNPEISLEIEEIILHGLAGDPADRYSSAAAMKAELDAPERVEVTGRANRLKAPTPFDSRWRMAAIVAVALVVPVLLFFVFLLILKR